MKVVILCGGLGTRLREEIEYHAKLPVAIIGRPIEWDVIARCLGYRVQTR